MSRQSHLISILQLYEAGQVAWTVDEIAERLGLSVRTAYRNVRELTQSGFLDPASGARYVLGPAFIRYDRVIRQSDPLIAIASGPMMALVDQASQEAAALLCRRFHDCVMSVHSVEGDAPHLPASYERGAAMSLFRGAPAKVILAFLPDRTLRGLYLRHEGEIRQSGVADYAAFRAELRGVRRAGVSVTVAEIGAGRLGIAAPILRGSEVLASLSLVVAAGTAKEPERLDTLVGIVREAAGAVSRDVRDA